MAIPSQERWKAAEAKRIAGVIRRRKGLPDVVDGGGDAEGKNSNAMPVSMFDQVRLRAFRLRHETECTYGFLFEPAMISVWTARCLEESLRTKILVEHGRIILFICSAFV